MSSVEMGEAAVVMLLSMSVAGCGGNAEERQANGVDRVLQFSEVHDGVSYRVFPTRHLRTVVVARYADMTTHEAVVVEHAVCEQLTCDFSLEPARLRISSATAGRTRVRVRVKRTHDGATFSDAFDVEFADAKRIAVGSGFLEGLAFVMPLQPDVRIQIPVGELRDASERSLSPERDALQFSIEGSAVARYEESSRLLVAVTPGISTLTWALPGQLETTVPIEVVAPPNKGAIAVRSSRAIPSGVVEAEQLRTWLAETPPLDVVELPATDTATVRLVVSTMLADGRNALAPDYAPRLAGLGEARTGHSPWQVTVEAFGAAGETTLFLGPEGTRTSVPVRFVSP